MTNYVKSTNFASKDSLPQGNALKIVKGTEIDAEFNNIAIAVATKADLLSPAFTGTPTASTAAYGTNTTQLATTAFVTAALQLIYPVGSIYTNASVATNPATLIGFGTWTQFGAGRVLIGNGGSFGAGTTGGSNDAVVVSHTHTFTGTALAGHAHTTSLPTVWSNGGSGGVTFASGTAVAGSGYDGVSNSVSAGTPAGTNSTTGVSGTNANLQPYVVVYMWQRTA